MKNLTSLISAVALFASANIGAVEESERCGLVSRVLVTMGIESSCSDSGFGSAQSSLGRLATHGAQPGTNYNASSRDKYLPSAGDDGTGDSIKRPRPAAGDDGTGGQ